MKAINLKPVHADHGMTIACDGARSTPSAGCGSTPARAAGSHEHHGKTYYFCGKSCLERFKANPDAFLARGARIAASAPPPPGTEYVCPMDPEVRQDHRAPVRSAAWRSSPTWRRWQRRTRMEYTCPMHPEVVRDAPGACPICGMALEPRTRHRRGREPRARRHDPAHVDRRTCSVCRSSSSRWATWCWAWGSAAASTMRLTNWIGLIFATPVVLWAGWPFFERAGRRSSIASANMFTLIALGVGAAYLFSVAATHRAGVFPGGLPRPRRRRDVLRHRGRDHRAGAARAGARAARARPHQRRDPSTARAGAEDSARDPATVTRWTSGCGRARRRPAARPARREGSGRRQRRRRAERGR